MNLEYIMSSTYITHIAMMFVYVSLAISIILMHYLKDKGGWKNILLSLLLPLDIFFGTFCAFLGSSIMTQTITYAVCDVCMILAILVIVYGIHKKSTTTISLAAISFEFSYIAIRLFGGFVAEVLCMYMIIIAFVHARRRV